MKFKPQPKLSSQWDHDVFPMVQKLLIIWFLFQVVVILIVSALTNNLGELFTYRSLFLIFLLGLASYMAFPFFKNKLGRFYVPVFISLLSILPTLITNLDFWLSDLPLMGKPVVGEFYRELPFILAAVIFTAWFYQLKGIFLYAVVITLINFSLYLLRIHYFEIQPWTWHLLGIRFVTIVFIGYLLATMVKYARTQGDRLAKSNAQLINYSATLEQLAANRERASMSRELHDTLSHSLTALTIQLEVTKALIEKDPDQAKSSVQTALNTAREGLKETRFALQHLRSGRIEQLGLNTGLNKLKADLRSNLTLDMQLPSEQEIEQIPNNLQNTLYRIAQESLHNVEKHSQAENVSIILSCQSPRIQLTIEDDGKGFNVLDHKGSGFGIQGMKERAMLAEGELNITSSPEQGTKIIATFEQG